ncbi:hypothetical protein CUMW_069260 [Citrus unshiu]|nr:hypothetical protein CUMW_069260 [Citrus unshiu]
MEYSKLWNISYTSCSIVNCSARICDIQFHILFIILRHDECITLSPTALDHICFVLATSYNIIYNIIIRILKDPGKFLVAQKGHSSLSNE